MTYHYSPDQELSQGDILRRVRVIINIVGGENLAPKFGESIIIVISRDCEIDKPLTTSNSVLVARIARLSSQSERMRDLVRENRVLNAFYLPADGQLMEESYIDWRTLQQVSKQILHNLRIRQEHYKCTLDKKFVIASLTGLRDFLTEPEDTNDK